METDTIILDMDKLVKDDPYIQINDNFTQDILKNLLLFHKRQEKLESHIQKLENHINLLSSGNGICKRRKQKVILCDCGKNISSGRLQQHKKTNLHKYKLACKQTNDLLLGSES